ncbi:MAG: hypothetical protein LAT62_12115, partial [Natronospirillum sp.]|nr:hypothetical protein [Natronospirillum sp.]
MNTSSLRFKLSASIAVLLFIAILVMVFIAWRTLNASALTAQERMTETLAEQAEDILRESTLGTSEAIRGLLGGTLATTRTLQTQLERTSVENNGEPYNRDSVRTLTLDTMLSNPSISALYVHTEPGVYDGLDDQFAGVDEHSSDVGTLDLYFVREGNDIAYYATEHAEKYADSTDEFGIREAEWYLCSMDRGETCL